MWSWANSRTKKKENSGNFIHPVQVLPGLAYEVDHSAFLGSTAATYRVWELCVEAGYSQPWKQPFSKGEIKANRHCELNQNFTAINRKALVAQS